MKKVTQKTGLTLAAVLVFATALCAQTTLFVSPQGSDENPGTADRPLATLGGARDAIRRIKKTAGLPEGGVVVLLVGGVYRLDASFTLDARDSGTEKQPIVYRAAKGEAVRLVGGRCVDGFRPVKDADVLERLDPAARGKVYATDLRAQGIDDLGELRPEGYARPHSNTRLELFFDARPMTLARWPNEGFVRIADVPKAPRVVDSANVVRGTASGGFYYSGDRPERWRHAEELWLHGFWHHDWADNSVRVASTDPERRFIATAPPHSFYGYTKGQRFYAFNLLEEVDAPGEWFLDRRTAVLYFCPPGPLEKGEVVVSLLGEPLVVLADVSHVGLEGMTLEAGRSDGVHVGGGSRNHVSGCLLRNLGGDGVVIRGGTGHRVAGCEITGVAGEGIRAEGGDRPKLIPAGHEIVGNHVHHYARWYRTYAGGVRIRGVGIRVANNLIHDAPHTAIFFNGNDHLIELNEIHHIAQETGDVGAIYTGRDWTYRGNRVRHNYIHHTSGTGMGSMGVYLDDCISGTEVFGNVFYEVRRAVMIGGGRDTLVENNLFIDCRPALQIDERGKGWAARRIAADRGNWNLYTRLRAMPYKEPPWSERYPKLAPIMEQDPTAAVGNRVVRNVCVGGWTRFSGGVERRVRFEDNLVGEDPRFVDRANGDFRLRPDSPAWKLGFREIPWEKIGLRGVGEP